jgi:hypothetical protein
MSWIENIFGSNRLQEELRVQKELIGELNRLIATQLTPLPNSGRPSAKRETEGNTHLIKGLTNLTNEVVPSFDRAMISYIRKVAKINPIVGQALYDSVQLSSTRYKIQIDGAKPGKELEMRREIENAAKSWVVGTRSLSGIVNKLFYQAYIGGATSAEWVPKRNLDGLQEVIFVNPENIVYKLRKSGYPKYRPYQRLRNSLGTAGLSNMNLKALNERQFCYVGMGNDEDSPYGVPLYLPIAKPVVREEGMLRNIDNIVKVMGILGYIDMKMEKPSKLSGETEAKYQSRMNTYLEELKTRALQGLSDGVNVGFIDEHEFNFEQTVQNVSGLTDIFTMNELQLASALKFDPAFLGIKSSTTETSIVVLFTKVISSITSIQRLVAENLSFGLTLHLRLKGYNFEALRIEFDKSTITDDLKWQQAQEIKIRNFRVLYADGIISQDDYADAITGKAPDQKEPRVPLNADAIVNGAKAKEQKEKGKDNSDRKGRDKKAPRGTIK